MHKQGTANSNSGSSFLQLLFVRVEKEQGQEGWSVYFVGVTIPVMP